MKEQRNKDLTFRTTRWERSVFEREQKGRGGGELFLSVHKGNKKNPAFGDFAREVFAKMYDPQSHREEVEGAASWAKKAHSAAEALPDFHRLIKRTAGRQQICSVATATIAEAMIETIPELKRDSRKIKEELQNSREDGASQERINKLEGMLKRAIGAEESAADTMKDSQSSIRRSIRKAVRKAEQEVNKTEEQAAAFGLNDNTGSQNGQGERARDLAYLIRSSESLRRIAKIAGRLKSIASRKQRTKSQFARERISSVETGANLARILPFEAAKLLDEDLELCLFRDLSERKVLQYRLSGKEKTGKGPIIFCVDESGSMKGERNEWSKAVFLAIHSIARSQGRACSIVHFDNKVNRIADFDPKEKNPEALIDSCRHFTGGGTDFISPLKAAAMLISNSAMNKKTKNADLIFITDGDAGPVGQWWQREKEKLGINCYGIHVGSGSGKETMRGFCDEVLSISKIAADSSEERRITNKIFSI